jgi:hypothetical protein
VIKCLAFVRRHPSVAAAAFAARWRQHAEAVLAASPTAAPTRLAHCVVRQRPDARPVADGVAISWHRDDDALTAYVDALGSRGTSEDDRDSPLDGEATEVVRVEERTVLGEDWLLDRWRSRPAEPTLVLIGLLQATGGRTRPAFRDYWWDTHRPLANRVIPPDLQPSAYVHDYVLPGEPSRWDGVGEMYESSLDVARQRGAWFDTPHAEELLRDERRFLDQGTRIVLVTDHEIVLGG